VVHKILRANNVKPHLTRTFKVSKDPRFDEKTTDVVGLYGNAPENAIVLSVDEKTSVQALERTQPMLPLTRGQIERHTHDYKRNGVVDLYAALEVATGVVTGQCTDTHTGADFLAFMKKVVSTVGLPSISRRRARLGSTKSKASSASLPAGRSAARASRPGQRSRSTSETRLVVVPDCRRGA
jgi:hypothetical protein